MTKTRKLKEHRDTSDSGAPVKTEESWLHKTLGSFSSSCEEQQRVQHQEVFTKTLNEMRETSSQEIAKQQAQFQVFLEESKEPIIQAVRKGGSLCLLRFRFDMLNLGWWVRISILFPVNRTSILPQGQMRPPAGLPQLDSHPPPTNQVTHNVVEHRKKDWGDIACHWSKAGAANIALWTKLGIY